MEVAFDLPQTTKCISINLVFPVASLILHHYVQRHDNTGLSPGPTPICGPLMWSTIFVAPQNESSFFPTEICYVMFFKYGHPLINQSQSWIEHLN